MCQGVFSSSEQRHAPGGGPRRWEGRKCAAGEGLLLSCVLPLGHGLRRDLEPQPLLSVSPCPLCPLQSVLARSPGIPIWTHLFLASFHL